MVVSPPAFELNLSLMDHEFDETPIELTAEEARVLGCLMEKCFTTPDVYPLTFNSLLTACNQKTNRVPVVDYDEDTAAEAIEGLRGKQLALRVDGAGSRVQKYRHRIDERLGLSSASQALLTVLLLRGPQTLGELRTRTERMHAFPTIESVETELTEAAEDCELPLWKRLPQAPGQKEARFTHLLFGETALTAEQPLDTPSADAPVAVSAVQQRNERIAELEQRVEDLEAQLSELNAQFTAFKEQFN